MRVHAASVVAGLALLGLAVTSPCAAQETTPSFADSASVLLLVGEDLGRVYGRIRVASSIECGPGESCEWAPSGRASGTASLELLEILRKSIDRGATSGWGGGMPVIGPELFARIVFPAFHSGGGSATVRIDLGDPAWGQSRTLLYFLEREGEGWRIVESLGDRGRIWPLPNAGGR